MLREQFDYVVVDTPPAFDDQVLAAFDRSDVIALLATLDIPALKNLKLTLETLELLNYPRERWRVVLNRADAKVGLALSEVEKTLRTADRRRRSRRRATCPPPPTAACRSSSTSPKHPVSAGDPAASPTQYVAAARRRPTDRHRPSRARRTGAGCLRRRTRST